MNFIEQLSAMADFWSTSSSGSPSGCWRRGPRVEARGPALPASDDLLSAGARVIYGVYTRDDDGYLQSLLSGKAQASGDPARDDGAESHGQELDR